MPDKISVFRSPESEARYYAAYDAVLKHWPVPYEELSISTRFGDTHIIASGSNDAAPLALLHPAAGGATIWCRNVNAFSQHYRTYAIDVIGEVNKSVLTRPVRSRRDFADWIADLFDGLQIESAYMVGNSSGGFLTLNTAFYLPERVKRIVLIGPAATFVQMWPWWLHFWLPTGIGYFTRSNHLRLKAYKWLWQSFPVEESIAKVRALSSIAGMPRHGPPSVFSDEELSSILTPVLLLIGDHEVIYKPERAIRRATRLVPNLKAETVPNANHIAEYTAADFVNAKILEFFRE
jgi:pimeloyl-ACP methyl ester carboxylesterase